MRTYVFIFLGGLLGALARYIIKNIQICGYQGKFPLNTFLINITGCLMVAMVLTIAFQIWSFDADIRMGIATGFFGAYTTFSALCKETVKLINDGDYFCAISYIALSTILGLAVVYLGMILARGAVSKLIKSKEIQAEKEVE